MDNLILLIYKSAEVNVNNRENLMFLFVKTYLTNFLFNLVCIQTSSSFFWPSSAFWQKYAPTNHLNKTICVFEIDNHWKQKWLPWKIWNRQIKLQEWILPYVEERLPKREERIVTIVKCPLHVFCVKAWLYGYIKIGKSNTTIEHLMVAMDTNMWILGGGGDKWVRKKTVRVV